MADRLTKEQRSKNMAAVKSRGNRTTELAFASLLRKLKISGWRRHLKSLDGCPDFAFSKKKLVIFIDGCFWHGCKKHCSIPAIRKKFWTEKITRNIARDKEISKHYKNIGWKIVRIWEHDLKKKEFDPIRKCFGGL